METKLFRKVLFLDRDGIIVEEDQVDSFEKIKYIPGVFTSLNRICREGDFYTVMVSNQDGVGTPSFPQETFDLPHQRIIDTLAGEGIVFDNEHIDFSLPADNCPGRKPKTGMLGEYMTGNYDLEHSFVIGDRLTDVQLAKNIGCKAIWFADVKRKDELSEELGSITALVSDNWSEVAAFLLDDRRFADRQAHIQRDTKETQISLSLNLDGGGKAHLHTHIGFFDHMLEQVAKHGAVNLEVLANGDLVVDEHHTIEDVGLALGQAFKQALGDKRGISRYGFEVLPMDEVLAEVALDFSGRPSFRWNVPFKREYIGTFPTEMLEHFFKSFSDASQCNLSMEVTEGNAHHQAEALFKAFGRAVRKAVKRNPYSNDLPSTKGVL